METDSLWATHTGPASYPLVVVVVEEKKGHMSPLLHYPSRYLCCTHSPDLNLVLPSINSAKPEPAFLSSCPAELRVLWAAIGQAPKGL